MNEHITTLVQDAQTPWETDDEAVEYAKDPRTFFLKRCEEFTSKVRLGTNKILVATYFVPESTKMKGPAGSTINFIIPREVTVEAKWQGRVGLLIAKGPMAWVADDRVSFGGTNHEIGTWVGYDRHDGRQVAIDRIHCRVMRDVDVWCETDDPFLVY